MIHDESDPTIDFSWFYFVGKTKLNLSFRETGKLTLTTFNKLYGHYKDSWDFEMQLAAAHVTYKAAFAKAQESEEWF